jgi:LacI family transcriptional regulator
VPRPTGGGAPVVKRLDSPLISPVGDVEGRLGHIKRAGIASVLVDLFSPDASVSSVSVDHETGARLAVQHLMERGHIHIGFIAGPASLVHQVGDRLRGVRSALQTHPEVHDMLAMDVLRGFLIAGRPAHPDAGRARLDRPAAACQS